MTARLPGDIDQYGVILYTCMWNSGLTIMPVGYTDITPDQPENIVVWKPARRTRHALRLLFTGKTTIKESELA